MLKIKEIRKSRGFTQKDMASFLSMSQGAYSQIENEKYKINVDMLCKIADILECSTDSILGRNAKEILTKNEEYYKKMSSNNNQRD